MGRLSGRPGRDINLLLEATLLLGEVLSWRHRGRGFTIDEASELWTPGLSADDSAFWEERVALLTGDAERARRLAQAAASRRDAIAWSHPDARDLAALAERGEGRRRATVAKYLTRLRSDTTAPQPSPARGTGTPPTFPVGTLPPPWQPPPPSPTVVAPSPTPHSRCQPWRRERGGAGSARERLPVPDYVPASPSERMVPPV